MSELVAFFNSHLKQQGFGECPPGKISFILRPGNNDTETLRIVERERDTWFLENDIFYLKLESVQHLKNICETFRIKIPVKKLTDEQIRTHVGSLLEFSHAAEGLEYTTQIHNNAVKALKEHFASH